MSKPKLYGMRSAYIPNAQADFRRKKKFYEKGKEYADNDEERATKHRLKEIKKWKEKQYANCKQETGRTAGI